MDPEENMTRQLELAQEILIACEAGMATGAVFQRKAAELAQLVQDQHDWASKGGFKPGAPTPEMVEAMRQRVIQEADERGVGTDQLVVAASPDGQHVQVFEVG